ncbi:MAG TPA: hypothetical protein VH593_26500, partial [Ktedonobacteraceae bacterium]
MRQHPHTTVHIVVLVLVLLAAALLPTDHTGALIPTCTAAQAVQSTGATTTLSAQAPPLYLGLDAYRNLDKLPYLELGDRVEGASTADPGGSNADNTHYVRALPDGEHVLFDQMGPGIMTFMRMQESYGSPWNLALDGYSVATINESDFGQTNPESTPASAFPYPLSLNPQESHGSSIVATTIPFQQSMQWSSQYANGNFYALYRKLPYGSQLPSANNQAAVQSIAGFLRCAGSNIAPPSLSQQQGNLALTAHEE